MIFGNKFLPIQEAFFGKSDTLLKAEEIIGEIRHIAKNSFADINGSSQVQAFNRLMEQEFGMECFALKITSDNIIDMYTSSIAARFDIVFGDKLKNCVKKTPNGYKFKPGNGLCIRATTTRKTLGLSNVTNAEFMAMILHEIGHNFADAMDKTIYVHNIKPILDYAEVATKTVVGGEREYYDWAKSTIKKYSNKNILDHEKNRKYDPVHGFLNGLSSNISNTMIDLFEWPVFTEILNRITFNPKMWITKVDKSNATKVNPPKRNEIFADTFAGLYGYNTELVSAIYKLENRDSTASKFVEKLPGGGKKNREVYDAFKDYMYRDEHPDIIQRLNIQIQYLKAELKDNKDPKYKNIIAAQIADLENLLKDYTTVFVDGTETDAARAAWHAFVNKEYPDGVDKKIQMDIRKRLDK